MLAAATLLLAAAIVLPPFGAGTIAVIQLQISALNAKLSEKQSQAMMATNQIGLNKTNIRNYTCNIVKYNKTISDNVKTINYCNQKVSNFTKTINTCKQNISNLAD